MFVETVTIGGFSITLGGILSIWGLIQHGINKRKGITYTKELKKKDTLVITMQGNHDLELQNERAQRKLLINVLINSTTEFLIDNPNHEIAGKKLEALKKLI